MARPFSVHGPDNGIDMGFSRVSIWRARSTGQEIRPVKVAVLLFRPARQPAVPGRVSRVSTIRGVLFVLAVAWGSAFAQTGVSPLRWSGPPGSRPGTHQEWAARHPVRPFSWKLVRHATDGPERVAVVVEIGLAGPLAAELDQFIADLQASGLSVSRYNVAGGTPEDLRALLRDAWERDSITGALLIGDLPVAWFQGVTFDVYDEWPVDLFYMDLDNTWSDSLRHGEGNIMVPGADGIYDKVESDMDLEIFVGRLTTTGLPDEIGLLRNYLRKDHEFRTGSMNVTEEALVFVDDDWQPYARRWSDEIGLAYPVRAEYFDPETTRATVYRRVLDTPRAWVSVFAHSWSGGHTFKFDGGRQRDSYYGYEYVTQDVPVLFYNHFACWFCRYTDSAYGGGQSIFNPTYGLGAFGSTKAGGMCNTSELYAPLGQGRSLGTSYKRWFDDVCGSGYSSSEQAWTLGMTLLGDPFLQPVEPSADAAVRYIVAPAGSVDSGLSVIPAAMVANVGAEPGTFTVTMTIGSEYAESVYTSEVAPGDSVPVTFDAWLPVATGSRNVTCSAVCAGDRNRENDTLQAHCIVRVPDVGVASILAPAGSIDTIPLIPLVIVQNHDVGIEQCWVHLAVVDSGGNTSYRDSAWVERLPARGSQTASLATWLVPHASGIYYATAWTWRPGDSRPQNDTARAVVGVVPGSSLPPGWHRAADVPPGAKNKKVKWGGALAAGLDGRIYALKGNGKGQFFAYDPMGDVWSELESIPRFGSTGKKKGVKNGGALVWAGDELYAVKGNKTLEFWRYSAGEGWREKRSVPNTNGVITDGAGLAWSGTNVYLLKGSKTYGCCSYFADRDSWGEEQSVMPSGGGSAGPFGKGSALTGDGGNRLYALKGKYNEFFYYDIAGDEWHGLPGLPIKGWSGHKRAAKDGTSIACLGDRVCALKGGSNELWCFDTSRQVWRQLEDFPNSGKKKKVGSGGALAWFKPTNSLYALRGNGSLELWAYAFPAQEPGPAGHAAAVTPAALSLRVEPNPSALRTRVWFALPQPTRVSLKLYDAAGTVRAVLKEGCLSAGRHELDVDAPALPRGVYLLRLDAGGRSASIKFVRP
ncbi:MAG: T9SS type A sorting domain-containing protein [candidate division WOR-3 bacterium]|nr:T9SS type A sorting domain-containing protein [candidate division WOR-3 bacterium]